MDSRYWFNEFNKHLMEDDKPSLYFKHLMEEDIFPKEEPLVHLFKLKKIDQNKKYHPEGNVFNHVMMVIDNAAKYKKYSEDQQVFMWGALLHDLGKLTTTKVRRGRITSYDHDKVGKELAISYLNFLTDDDRLTSKVSYLVRWHMQPLFVNKDLPFKDLRSMVHDVLPSEIALLSLCDRLGRGGIDETIKKKEVEGIISFLKKAVNYIKNKDGVIQIIESLEGLI